MNAVIIGGGQVGSYIAKLLLDNGCTVKVIEKREDVLEKLRAELPSEILVVGGGADPHIMEKAGIQQADVVAAVTGADEINLVASTIAKYEFGVPRVIARVNHPKNEWLFTAEMGVDVPVNQANLLARLVVDEIDLKHMITLMKINRGKHSISQFNVEPGSLADGKSLKELPMPEDAVLIAIHRGDEVILPRGETVVQADDRILALCSTPAQQVIDTIFAEPQ